MSGSNDGELVELDSEINLDKNKKHDIAIVADRIAVQISKGALQIYSDSLEQSGRPVTIDVIGGEELVFSEKFACVDCGISIRN